MLCHHTTPFEKHGCENTINLHQTPLTKSRDQTSKIRRLLRCFQSIARGLPDAMRRIKQ
jgi:hypothetical protein